MDSLIGTYGAIFQSLLTLSAIVTFFISFAMQRKVERCRDILEKLKTTNWDAFSIEEAGTLFDSTIENYEAFYESIKLSGKAKSAIFALYGLSALTCVIILVLIESSLNQENVPKSEINQYCIVSFLSIVVIIVLGVLFYDIVTPERAWIFRADKPIDLCSADHLSEKLNIPTRVIVEKFGLIRISGVRQPNQYYVEFCNHLLKKGMKYKVILKSEKKEIQVKRGTLDWDIYMNFEVTKSEFPSIFQSGEK